MATQKIVAGTAISVAAILMIVTALALNQASTTVTHSGTIQTINVGVFSDSACSKPLSALEWGAMAPGASLSKTIYVKNTGNAALTLNMTVTSWNPSAAASYITLIWNRQNYVLTAGTSVSALLTLSVSSSVNGFTSFSCVTIIAGNA